MRPCGVCHLAIVALAVPGIGQEEPDARRLASLIRGMRTGEAGAAEGLIDIGRPAVPELLEVVQSSRPPARFRAIEVLGRMRAEASAALPALVAIGPDLGGTELPVLIRAIGNLYPYRESEIPELAATLTPWIIKAYSEVSGEARLSVLMTADRTLARFEFEADAPLEELLIALQGGDSYLRELAAELLGHRGSDARPALRLLDDAAASFYHPEVPGSGSQTHPYSAEVQRSAANAILAIATDEELVIGRAHAIRVRVGDPAEQLASVAELTRLAPDLAADPVTCSEVVFHLAERIDEDRTSNLAREAIVTLGEIGMSLRDWTAARYWLTTAVPLLQELTRSRDEEIARRAKSALSRSPTGPAGRRTAHP